MFQNVKVLTTGILWAIGVSVLHATAFYQSNLLKNALAPANRSLTRTAMVKNSKNVSVTSTFVLRRGLIGVIGPHAV